VSSVLSLTAIALVVAEIDSGVVSGGGTVEWPSVVGKPVNGLCNGRNSLIEAGSTSFTQNSLENNKNTVIQYPQYRNLLRHRRLR